MRVAYVCADPGVPVFGKKGCSVHAQEVIRSLRGRGASVELFARRLGGDPPPGLQAVPVHRLPALIRNIRLHAELRDAASKQLETLRKRRGATE